MSTTGSVIFKSALLLRALSTNPKEFFDRVRTKIDVLRARQRVDPDRHRALDLPKALRELGLALDQEIESILLEPGLADLEEAVQRNILRLRASAPFSLAHNADFTLARACYVICRILRPTVVLETGVAYGVTSASVLQVLSTNGKGQLWSVDLPPLGLNADKHVGCLIPEEQKSRWHLCRGMSRRVLPPLLKRLGEIDFFIHDSLHTSDNMQFEFGAAWPRLAPGGILMADDVNDSTAFDELEKRVRPAFSCVVRQETKQSLFGLMVKTR